MKLKNKVAIITGAGRGIGRAIALAFAKEGAKIVVNSLHADHAESVTKEIKKAGGVAIAAAGDVSSSKDVKSLFSAAMKKFKKIDILVNNAGVVHFEPLVKITEKEWNETVSVDLKGTFFCSQAAAKVMKKGGKIINISSIAGVVGFAQLAPYCASKGGVIELTRELALELAPDLAVNGIGPGVIETDMTKDLLADKKTRDGLLASIPMGRAGKPEEIAKAAVFLASDDSSYMTGQTIFVDGGWTVK
ncbi:MAG: 3-oxoacyl-ACP reductase family protein [Nanoarchaeota archaeon]|nr:3-oxoacyl-ACP reductase FabG [Nanoarchaeota archaeon]MBU4451652.1 3-oxoacyl-ACP reductase FabG [Nanoarchaeota archaeon]MCG2723639.1 3-oxoacyl-ACP reductase FabG [archaeon]